MFMVLHAPSPRIGLQWDTLIGEMPITKLDHPGTQMQRSVGDLERGTDESLANHL